MTPVIKEEDDDLLSMDEQIEMIVEAAFTAEGPHYNADIKQYVDGVVREAAEKAPSDEVADITRMMMAAGAVNSAIIAVVEDYGLEAAGLLLQAMSQKYMDYVGKTKELH